MRPYIPRQPVMAEQLTLQNFHVVERNFGGRVYTTNESLMIDGMIVNLSDWVVKMPDHRIKVYGNEEFHFLYKKES